MDNAQLAGRGMCTMTDQRRGGASTVKPHLQWIVKASVVVPRPGQEGGGDGRPCSRSDIEESAARGAGGRAAEGRRSDTGEVDAERESGLF